MSKAVNHSYKTEGSDSKPYRMIPMCTCGWSGEVVDGQGRRSQEVSKQQWATHIMEADNGNDTGEES